MTLHLTHEQLCDLIIAAPDDSPRTAEAAHDHLRDCLICSAELQSLRDSLSLFRNATHSFTGQQYAQASINRATIAPSPGYFSQAVYWAATTVLAIAVILPLSLHRQHTPDSQPVAAAIASPQTTESDEALLEGIAQDLSTNVPSPMRALADPTAGATEYQSISEQRKN